MDEHRSRRVSVAVREELSEIIGFELSDPRLRSVDVTDVTVSPDSRHAMVKVSLGGGGEHEQNQAMAALDHARNYLRHELASRLNLRKIPELHFEPDYYPDAATRVEILLKRAKKKRAPTENQP
jgi:ribosome-binding factor A